MEQLPLEVRLADHAVFRNFHAAGNEALVHALLDAAAGVGHHLIWLWGPRGSGRSHLLQAAVAGADQAGRRALHVPLERSLDLPAGILEGLEAAALVAIDDVDAVAGQPDWERGLFTLFEKVRAAGGTLLLSAAAAPAAAGIALPDLASRFASGLIFRVQPLDDEGLLAALTLRARFRGFELPAETGRFLLTRLSRRPADLFRLLDDLDRAGLAAQKRLTIPFVRQVIASSRPASG